MAEHALIPWKTLDRRLILDCGKFLKVEMHTVELPDGRVIDDWTWVISPDFVNVVAETVDGDYLCFRQTNCARSRAHHWRWWAATSSRARRRCQRRNAKLWRKPATRRRSGRTGAYPVEANRGVQTGHFFLARGARRVADPIADDLEEQEILHLTPAEMAHSLAAGRSRCWPGQQSSPCRYRLWRCCRPALRQAKSTEIDSNPNQSPIGDVCAK